MLLKEFVLDSKSQYWDKDFDHVQMFLRMTNRYINDVICTRGYIYLNEIYELCGVKWDTNNENICFTKDGIDQFLFIEFEVFILPDDSYLIHICHR